MTSTSTGPLLETNRRPSCSCSAVKIDGPAGSADGRGASDPGGAPDGDAEGPLSVHCTLMSYNPGFISVLSTIGRPTCADSSPMKLVQEAPVVCSVKPAGF